MICLASSQGSVPSERRVKASSSFPSDSTTTRVASSTGFGPRHCPSEGAVRFATWGSQHCKLHCTCDNHKTEHVEYNCKSASQLSSMHSRQHVRFLLQHTVLADLWRHEHCSASQFASRPSNFVRVHLYHHGRSGSVRRFAWYDSHAKAASSNDRCSDRCLGSS